MTVDLFYYLDGQVYKLTVEPTRELFYLYHAIRKDHKAEFERRGIGVNDLILYALSNLKREELPERINDVIASERLLELDDDIIGDVFGERLYDETLVHLFVLVRQPGRGLEDFLASTTLLARTVNPTKSTSTHHYDTALLPVKPQNIPYFLVKFETMAESMTDDLFSRVLPRHPISDQEAVENAKASVRMYCHGTASVPLTHEPTVCDSTRIILNTCTELTRAVGLSFDVLPEQTNVMADVMVDRVVRVRSSNNSPGGIAVEDKSPSVYEKHCNDFEVNRTCGELRLGRDERSFRSILFKLAIYMVCEKIRWGIIHSGVNMRIVRIEYQDRPYVIISEQIPVDSPAPRSMYSLICYMLLTSSEDIDIFDGIKAAVPASPPIQRVDSTRLNRRNPQNVASDAPGNPSRAVLHGTAAAGTELLDIPMQRVDKLPVSSGDTGKLDIYITNFLGAGGFGRVFRGDLFVEDQKYCGPVIVKLARAGLEKYLTAEAAVYRMLHSLSDTGIPKYYGHFTGDNSGFRYSCILISYCGDALKAFDDLSPVQRIELFRILWNVHQAGVVHEDIRPSNVLQSESCLRLMDFSTSTLDHQCEGVDICKELVDTAKELRLARDDIWTALH